MVRFVTEHTEIVCNPPYADWHCALTVGSTSALDQAYRMICERGDYVLSEEYTFASAVETALPLGIKFAGVKMDDQGLIAESMDEILSNWNVQERGARKPRVLYTVPSGQNPTGATQGTERRKAIYKVAQKHDIYIFEDEPYYFLQMQPYTGPNAAPVPPPENNEAFLKALIPTYLSMDVDGRVMRMDSFSKVIAPGTRVGWITASEQIIERFVRHNECSNQNPSGISQIILYKMLDESWGHSGYLQWLINLRLEYTRRRDAILAACEKFLPKEIVSWNPPAAGMFVCPSPLLFFSLRFLFCSPLTSKSSGSKSPITCTHHTPQRRSSTSKKKSSSRPSKGGSSSPAAPGSQRSAMASYRKTCFSAPRLRRRAKIRWRTLLSGLGRLLGRVLGWWRDRMGRWEERMGR